MIQNQINSTVLSQPLENQLHKFIDAQAQRCSSRVPDIASQERILTNFHWAHRLAIRHYQSRINRATDLQSLEVTKAQELARQYIGAGNHDFFATCVDGRNMPTVMFSKPPHVGGVLRAPAGTVNGFLPGQAPDTVFIDHSTFVVSRLSKLLQEKVDSTIFYGLDSHISCAARAQIHETEGGLQADGGTRSDVLNKLMTARGILQLRAELLSQGKAVAEVIPTFFSFDPNTGGVWFGLEAHTQSPEVTVQGFTSQLLQKLADSGAIINSRQLLEEPIIHEELIKVLHPSSADFREAYSRSLFTNWEAITKLYANGQSKIYEYLLDKMSTVYQKSGWLIGQTDSFDHQRISERTIKQKTKFLLKNLVTRFSIAGIENKWSYDHHQEEMVVITDGGYAPFSATDAFAVFSRDLNALLTNTKLTIDLIRSSRRLNKLANPFPEIPFNQADFIAAPVLISNKAIVKGLSETDWKTLDKVNLDQIFNQINWDDQEVLNWRKSNIIDLILTSVSHKHITLEMSGVLRFVDGVYELFERMQRFLSDKHFRQMMFSGSIIILNSIVDHNRCPRMILRLVV